MDRNGALAAVLLILVVAGDSDASKFRLLAGEGKGSDKPNSQKVSPSPTSNPLPKVDPLPSSQPPPPKTEQLPLDAGKSNGTNTKGGLESGSPSSVPPPLSGTETTTPQDPKTGENDKKDKDSKGRGISTGSESGTEITTPQGPKTGENDKKDKDSKGNGSSTGSESGAETTTPQGPKTGENDKKDKDSKGNGSSTGSESTTETSQEAGCNADKCKVADLVACLQHPTDETTELFLLVQNGGENDLIVNINTSISIGDKMLQVAKHGAEKISVSTNVTNVIEVVLNAGKGDCILYIRPSVSDWNPFQQFPAYATQLTPIHGAYFLFFSIIITGVTWTCCKFGRKTKRGDSVVPYQQLEMGTHMQSSSSVGDTNTADGWDQSWDDDWDEEEAVARPSKKHLNGTVSSNGLTSRPPNKDGWDFDWDD